MKNENVIQKRKTLKVVAIILLVLVILFGAFLIYASIYYKADDVAIRVLDDEKVKKYDDYIIIESENSSKALIFYPGAKVQFEAYLPILQQISKECNINVVLVKMPFNMAIFSSNTADKFIGEIPNATEYYVGGHSMGGAMASSFASKNSDKVAGLILMGAYIYGDYPPQKALTIYGSLNYKVADKVTYTENVIEIEGGNHANFGNYGKQKGDMDSVITREEQQKIAVDAINDFIN